MKSAGVFASKEFREILRTWRIWVLPGIMFFFAVGSPFFARYAPEIITAVAGNELGGLTLPQPTYLDSYSQWVKNLTQITLFAVIIIYGGIISSERTAGTAILVLTKPLSRSAFVIVKAIVHSAFLGAVLVVGTLVTWGLTAAVFGTAPAGPIWSSALVWLALGVFFIALMTLLSASIPSPSGAAGAGIAAFILLSVGAIWKPFNDYSPAGLSAQATSLAAGTAATSPFWSVVTSLALSVIFVWLATVQFRRIEL